MALSLTDKWIWDFWLVEDEDGLFHVFYLQAPKSLGNPDLRHWNVTIGHAVSTDLTNWTLRPDALAPSVEPSWDDKSTWTGSIIRHEERWYLFYTGTSHAEDGLVQRAGMAWSDDLDHWHKHDGPLIAADDRWYETLEDANWPDEAWRDPWVFLGDDGYHHALLTARTNTGERMERGCIAHARSSNLVDWEVLPPITTPGGFGQLEVPQVHEIDGQFFLLFCCDDHLQTSEQQAVSGGTGTFYMRADAALGPYAAAEARPLSADLAGTTYAGRVIDRNGPQFLAWLRNDAEGVFVGELSDPQPVSLVGQDLKLS